ncbi:hypothetical protein MIND_01405900 [Mycena indigotica]|uniref:Uncharacterized protein n=1 Tax=Mycena indigotica TaxID=2126181 RepID=A0A8H6VPI8_9AGAR|nr:uncharacterized protein MIND_01405900 [Mycena indigotica]KAF7288899.1 hypothetical protein MIND_01405900 [Mycena indigotica]
MHRACVEAAEARKREKAQQFEDIEEAHLAARIEYNSEFDTQPIRPHPPPMIPPSPPLHDKNPPLRDFQHIADTLANQEVEKERLRSSISPEERRLLLDQEFERILAKELEREWINDSEVDDVDQEDFEQQMEPDDIGTTVPQKDSGFFPWPNETILLLDVMDNLPRCRFTGAQMTLVLHMMKRLGVQNIPSLKTLRKIQKQVHEGFGNTPVKVQTPQGNVFYTSNLRQAIARDFANPLIAPHLNLYPEDVGSGPMSERWQAERAFDYDARPAHTHVFEWAMSLTWIRRNGNLTSDVYIVARDAEGVWDCGGEEQEVMATSFEADFDRLRTEFGSDFHLTWTDRSREFIAAMPTPFREISGDRDLYVLGISVWIDDVSGNKSKQYNKFLVMVMQNTALPGQLLKQEFHVHFSGASQHVTTAELSAVLRDFVQGTEISPIICYNANTRREAAVVVRVHDDDADNPQQSEEASHIGCNGLFPCRKCKWGGPKADQVGSDTYHACHEPGISRTAADIRSELEQQLALAMTGSAAAIEKRQRETGTKDKLTQYWIERVLVQVAKLKQENPRISATDAKREAQMWLDQQPGDKMNPLLDITGLDPARDTPVEILHTILLGVIKYIWHHLNTQQWSDVDRQLLAIRLQSTDISGMNVPPVRGAYMMQYRNNLIGKHFKVIMQALTFHTHEICTPVQFQLVKAAADLGARVWISVIDDIEAYIVDLKIAIANVLDAWDAVEPLRILVKIKLHLLPHLPEDIRRFGPAVRFSTETQESYNAVFRMCSINGNHQAPSRDIAVKFSTMNNIKHALCGGFWESTSSRERSGMQGAPEWHREWLQPGEAVRRILADDLNLQRHLGWVTHAKAVPGLTRLLAADKFPPIPWDSTRANGAKETLSPPKLETKHKLALGFFVRNPNNKLVLGRVAEILSRDTRRSWVTLEQFVCTTQRHPEFDWPVVRRPTGTEITEDLLTSYLVVPGSQLEFSCSVQHDCRLGGCQPAVMGKERQERQETVRDISLIKHIDDDKFVLNMGSTHNFVELLRVLPPALCNLRPLQLNRRQFHHEMAQKAKSARSTAREKATAKQRETAAKKKKQKAAKPVEEEEEQDLPESESESDTTDDSDDNDYIPKDKGGKRGRAIQESRQRNPKRHKANP